ncbi:hypothetical protein ABZ403_21145 [Micromonospora zamorensis]|uniref:hypothetical protein n=1 Tax=Micromonospora zamorensis TaxID=709883 RepID=UPI0033D2D4BE
MPERADAPSRRPADDPSASLLTRLRSIRRGPAVMGAPLVLTSLAYATSVAGYKWHLHTKAERLRAEGVPVLADVSDRRDTTGRGGGTDTIQVGYRYEGVRYSERILCGSAGGCTEEPPAVLRVWVDPVHPEPAADATPAADASSAPRDHVPGLPGDLPFLVGADDTDTHLGAVG